MSVNASKLINVFFAFVILAASTLGAASSAFAGKKHYGNSYKKKRFVIIFRDGSNSAKKDLGEDCPQDFNCGHRIYSDQTGPRIIQLGSGETGTLDDHGPRIIRLRK